MTNVTKTFFPELKEYILYLQKIWDNKWMTNRGELLLELEDKIQKYLNVNHLTLMSNGTLPIQIALRILAPKGEVITTPFSYVATTSAILWEYCKPIFVDIDENYLTINEDLIEGAITSDTKAILATHVFGNPCNVEKIEKIAKKYSLHVIYDAAHCFGVNYLGKSIFTYGDISTCSFHATKLFHSGEGGAAFTNNLELSKKIFYSHNFGHNGPLDFHGLGINGKMSELHAAMGLCVLNHIDNIILSRKYIVEFYNKNINFFNKRKIVIRDNTDWNYSYYPIIFQNEKELLIAQEKMSKLNIFPRRYFYPSLNTISFLNNNSKMDISESISSRILCLPLSDQIDDKILVDICEILNS